LSTVCCIWL